MQNGADLNQKNYDEQTPYQKVKNFAKIELIELLKPMNCIEVLFEKLFFQRKASAMFLFLLMYFIAFLCFIEE